MAYSRGAVERAMKVQEVILRAIDGKLTWVQAADILGYSPRTIRRIRWRLQHYGYDGLLDRRRQTPSPKRAPVAEVQRLLALYRERYLGFNVRHFHQLARRQHGVRFCYAFVKKALQTAGLVASPGPRTSCRTPRSLRQQAKRRRPGRSGSRALYSPPHASDRKSPPGCKRWSPSTHGGALSTQAYGARSTRRRPSTSTKSQRPRW